MMFEDLETPDPWWLIVAVVALSPLLLAAGACVSAWEWAKGKEN